jgi:membrane associated rhomboid family serine protease
VDTSGTAWWSIAGDLVLLALFGFIAITALRGRPRRAPVLAVIAVLVIGIPSLLQFAVPAVGRALERDPGRTLGHGEWWRPVTALLAQDGGLVAAVFNLVVVAYVVVVAEQAWGRGRTLLAFLGTSVAVNLVALAWGAHGGGSSFAVDGSMLALAVRTAFTRSDPAIRVIAAVMTAIGVGLAIAGDAHGLAMLVGAGIGVLITAFERAAR